MIETFSCQLCFVFFFIHLSKNSRSLICGSYWRKKEKGEREGEKDRVGEREERGLKVEKIEKEGRGREEG